MAVALLFIMGSLGVAALVAWIFATRLSYQIERLRDPSLPRPRLMMTNIFRSAFSTAPGDATDPALRNRLRVHIYTALACVLAMAVASFILPFFATQPAPPAEAQAPPPAPDPTGTTLTYIRSNQDGTLPERVIIHVISKTEVHVAKMVAPCTDAAYVTGVFDPATQEATRLVGGRLNREGGQDPQVWLDFVPATRSLEVRLGDPASKPAEIHKAPRGPWRMYDFDLAEFALFGPRETKDVAFGMAMAWPDGTSPMLRILGDVKAHFLYSSDKGARNHFRIGGAAFTDPVIGDRGGEMITDAKTGQVIEARFGRPNHTEYANFQIKLSESVEGSAGDEAWKTALAAHWANCPAEP